jgi:integrase
LPTWNEAIPRRGSGRIRSEFATEEKALIKIGGKSLALLSHCCYPVFQTGFLLFRGCIMPKQYPDFVWVGSGDASFTVGYTATERGGFLGARFSGPKGNRLEKMTQCKKVDQNFKLEAARLIAKAYAEVYPDTKKVTWDDALKVIAADLREDTHIAYTKAVRIMRETLDANNIKPTAPSQVTSETAALFSKLWLSGTYKRSKASDAKEYKRKPTTLAFYLRQLSAVWEQFIPLGYVKENPWKSVRKPKVDKVVKPVPTEDQTGEFFAWVKGKYPEWERLHAFLELKAFSACRTADICELRSEQLQNGRVIWSAEQVKQREGRAVLLPDDLFQMLSRVAGPVHLWEGFIDDMRKFRRSKNRKSESFTPKTVAHVVGNIFREYSEAHPEKPRLSPHSLRRRGITLTVAATGSVDVAANAIGVTAACAKGYYVSAERAFNTDATFRKLANTLRMPTAPNDTQAKPKVSHESPQKSE